MFIQYAMYEVRIWYTTHCIVYMVNPLISAHPLLSAPL